MLLKDLAAEDRSGWTPQARSDRVRDLAELHERTAPELVRTVEGWDTGSDWALDGHLSAPAWLAWQTRATKTDAAKLVRTARFVRRYHTIAEALTGGDVAVAHVEAMARAERHHEDEFALSADALLTAAKEMGPTEFADVCRTWAHFVDDHKPAHDFDDRAFRIRYLMDGWGVPDGLLDPETCAMLETCFKDLAPPTPPPAPNRSAPPVNATPMPSPTSPAATSAATTAPPLPPPPMSSSTPTPTPPTATASASSPPLESLRTPPGPLPTSSPAGPSA